MEQIQGWVVRWIDVAEGYTISWNLQPHKRGINLGIFKHPGTTATFSPSLKYLNSPSNNDNVPAALPAELDTTKTRHGAAAKIETSDLVATLEAHGLKCVSWEGKCEADKISVGRYHVPQGQGGTYGIVLDNTFSRAVAKTATLAYVIHATDATPKFGGLRTQQRQTSAHIRPSLALITNSDTDGRSIPQIKIATHSDSDPDLSAAGYFTGVMYKKRRKRNQGYAKRFFSLDFTTATLSYYRNSRSSALRGAIPLALASIGIDGRAHLFHIDSGAEVWHLRLRHSKDFDAWKNAINRVARSPHIVPPPSARPNITQHASPSTPFVESSALDREWQRVEELVGRVSGSRHAVRRLALDTDPKNAYTSFQLGSTPNTSSNDVNTASSQDTDDQVQEQRSFWKRKPSSGSQTGTQSLFRRVSGQSLSQTPQNPRKTSPAPAIRQDDEVHQRCLALLRDLDDTVADFSALLIEHKAQYAMQPLNTDMSRTSIESTRSELFFDAEDGLGGDKTQIMHIVHTDGTDDAEKDLASSDDDSTTSSDANYHPNAMKTPVTACHQVTLFPCLPKDMIPKDVVPVAVRDSIAGPKQPPPSIIGFLRKNAGKDLSTVAMPVSANEPTSLLQRLAEPLESASLLTSASSSDLREADHVVDRLMYISAFAIAGLASNRVKERAIRKPFNPMLGETYELVRSESYAENACAYRFVAEKVTHHPVQMAWQADSLSGKWSISQSPQPTQKFWGKSMELNTEGKVRVSLHAIATSSQSGAPGEGGERYSWTQATCFLRNIIAGEKYVEPVQSMTVVNEDTGHRAVVTFKTSGMFSGRSEEVTVAFYSPESQTPLPVKLTGKWTTSLSRSDTGDKIWEAAPTVHDAAKIYGFTAFAMGLNEVTELESNKLAPTDSRLRPDQRALEDGDMDKAEAIKAKLEERQRSRRKTLEAHDKTYEPAFFTRTTSDSGRGQLGHGNEADEEKESWTLKTGQDGYWQRRERQAWGALVPIFEA